MIDVRGLVKRHGTHTILNGIDLAIARGTVTALIGPSGGGKSTLLRCLNGLEQFQEGSVAVGDLALKPGANPSATLRQLRRRVGMVFQQFHLFPHLSVLDNVLTGPRLALGRADAEPDAVKLLDRVGLKDKIRARPDQLSGGQQQRVAIARTLAVQPEAVLFDEPTSALDPRMAAEVMAVIADLAADGLTLVVVTHEMDLARRATMVQVLHGGKVAEGGPAAQVFGNPQTDLTREFLRAVAVSP